MAIVLTHTQFTVHVLWPGDSAAKLHRNSSLLNLVKRTIVGDA